MGLGLGAAVVGLVVSFLVLVLVAERRVLTTAPLWLILFCLVFLISPYARVKNGLYPPTLLVTPSQLDVDRSLVVAVGMVAVFTFAWAIGYRRTKCPGRSVCIPPTSGRHIVVRLIGLQVLFFGVYLGGYVLSGVPVSGAFSVVTTAGRDAQRALSFAGLTTFGSAALITLPVIMFAYARSKSLSPFWVRVVYTDLVLTLAISVLTGTRYRVAILVLALVLVAHASSGLYRVGRTVSILVVFLIAFVPLAIYMSTARVPGRATNSASLMDKFQQQTDMLSAGAAVYTFVNDHGIVWFGSFLDLFDRLTFEIFGPSEGSTTISVIQSVTNPDTGAAMPSTSELYLNFGLAGSLVFLLVSGLYVGAWQSRRDHSDPFDLAAIALTGPIAAQILTRGYVFQTFATFLYTFVLIWLLKKIFSNRSSDRDSDERVRLPR